MLKGRLGLETARIPQADRHGLLWLGRGSLAVEDGTLRFRTVGGGSLPAGDFAIPFQMVNAILLEPGTTLMITDRPVTSETTTDRTFTVIATDDDPAQGARPE